MNKSKSIATEKVASIGVFVLLALYPIILTDKYFNITITRYLTFTIASAFFFALCLILRIQTLNKPKTIQLPQISEISRADMFFTLFVVVAVFSTFSSSYGAAAISGGAGRRMGLLMILSTYFAYMFISKFYKIREYEFIFFGLISSFMGLFGLLQYIGLDPLGLLKGLSELDQVRFISFMGNINIYSSFICIVLPLAMYMFCFSEKKLNSFFWLFVTSATFIGFLTTISDSGYLGVGAAIIVLVLLTTKDQKAFKKVFIMFIVLLLSGGFFKLIWGLCGDPEHPSSVPNDIITNPKIIFIGVLLSVIAIIAINRFDISKKAFSIIRWFVISATVAVIVACVATVIWYTLVDTTAELGKLSYYLRFSKNWGNGRGFAWTKLLEIFSELPLHKQLIGTGPDTIAYEMVSRHNEEMYELFGFYYDNAHNELIQYLVTLGLWGMLTYVCLVGSAVRSSLKADTLIGRAMILPIVGYFAQSLVNISQPLTTPLFFVFLAFSQCVASEEPTSINLTSQLGNTTNESEIGG